MKTLRVLLIDEIHPCLPEAITSWGWTCDDGSKMSADEIIQRLPHYEGWIIRSRFRLTKDLIDKGKQLEFIARPGAGLENIDVEYAKKKGIHVFNSPEGNRDAVGEQALGMLLTLFNQLKQADSDVRNGVWDRVKNRGTELKGKTVGIIGYGNMGSTFAKKLLGFEVEVIAYDKYKQGFSSQQIREVELETIFVESDVLSIHTPLTEETHHMVDFAFLDRFKKSIYLINTARGAIIKTDDLVSAIESGKVLGACLDVLEYESTSFEQIAKEGLPPAFEYLTKSDKVILSPHVAGWTHESNYKMSAVLIEKIKVAFLS